MNKQSKGRKIGAKNKERVSWEELNKQHMMLTGFVKSQNELRMRICRECGPLAGLLYTQLLSHYNTTSGKCFPSTSTLEKETCISKRKISDLIMLDISLFVVAVKVTLVTIGFLVKIFLTMMILKLRWLTRKRQQ